MEKKNSKSNKINAIREIWLKNEKMDNKRSFQDDDTTKFVKLISEHKRKMQVKSQQTVY